MRRRRRSTRGGVVVSAVAAVLVVSLLVAPLLSGGASARSRAARQAAAAVSGQESDGAAMLECLGGQKALDDLVRKGSTVPDKDVNAQIRNIASWVEQARGLRFEKRPTPTFLTREQIDARVRRSITKDYPAAEARLDSELLAALGAVPPGTDLLEMQTDLLSGQVAGYYDSSTAELVVQSPRPGAVLGPTEKVTLAHELQHALTDQALGLPDFGDAPPSEADARSAATALIEGDATVTMQRYSLSQLSLVDQLDMLRDPTIGAQNDDLEKYPQYLQRALVFPYFEGLTFVCALIAKGGWKAVDAAYRDLPTTTAQVLFPERYAAREGAVAARAPGRPAAPWKRARTVAVGAADLLFLFEAPGDRVARALSNPRRRAAAWAGGEIVQWSRPGAGAIGIALVERKGHDDLCDSVSRWYRAAFPDAKNANRRPGETFALDGARQDAVLRCSGGEVRLGIAPELTTARALAR